jgi:hypothetical protein
MEMVFPETLKHEGQLTVLVCGGRDFSDHLVLFDILERYLDWCEERELLMIVVQGGAAGADAHARQWTYNVVQHQGANVKLVTEPANWEKYGRGAGPIRNQKMIDVYDVDICFCVEGKSGTDDMKRRCQTAGIPVVS